MTDLDRLEELAKRLLNGSGVSAAGVNERVALMDAASSAITELIDRLRNTERRLAAALTFKEMYKDAGHLAEERIRKALEIVKGPSLWSALDGRRRLLHILTREEN